MSIYYQNEAIAIHHGNCLDILRELPDASVAAVCTDPPYGLANTDPARVADTIVRWVNGDRDYIPSGSGFMGKAWDAFVPPVAVWDECLRVLKPGGHALVFAGSRTVDLMTLGLRLAGFEIRDSIAHLYGSGFPKSLDVSKAIDRMGPPGQAPFAEFAAHYEAQRKAKGLTHAAVCAAGGWHGAVNHGGSSANWANGYGMPTVEQWAVLRPLLDLDDRWSERVERIQYEREVIGVQQGAMAGWSMDGETRFVDRDITAPASPDAERWQGWGTALKPAHEPIVVARKPLAGTVAANVLAHGTGALNVDGCRVAMSDEDRAVVDNRSGAGFGTIQCAHAGRDEGERFTSSPAGRWPANVVLDESQAAALDAQSGECSFNPAGVFGTAKRDAGSIYGAGDGLPHDGQPVSGYGDRGGASRFMYVAKADASERVRVNGTAHPTVKPLALMRWLVRLVTPPGGTVLEPFAGSGTTVEACLLEGFDCIAIEREADYLPLIRQRINRRRDPVQAVKATGEDGGLFDLFTTEEPA